MQRFDADGAKIGTEVRILFDRPLQESLGQGILRDGSAIVAYRASQYMNTVDFVRRDSLLIQRYGVDGAPIGAPTEVTFDEYHGFGNPGYTAYEAAWVLAWDDGSFLVAWRELDVTNRSDLGTSHFVSQRYAAAGQAVGTPRTIASSALGYGVVTVAFTEMDDGGYLTAQTFFNSGVPTYRFVPFDSADRTSAIPASWPGLPQFTRLLPLATEGHLLRAGAAGPFTQILDDTGALVAQPAVHAGDVHVLADGGFVAVWRGSAPAGQPDLLVQRYDRLGAAVGAPTPRVPAASGSKPRRSRTVTWRWRGWAAAVAARRSSRSCCRSRSRRAGIRCAVAGTKRARWWVASIGGSGSPASGPARTGGGAIMIRVGIVDDHAIVRNGLKQFFCEQVDLRVVGEAANGREAIDLVRTTELDVLVMDLAMPGQSGIDALAMVRAKAPDVGILILSGYPEEQDAMNLVRRGASGYLNKECEPMEIVNAIRLVALGHRYVCAAVAGRMADQLNHRKGGAPHEQLSEREFQVFLKLAKGEPPGEVATELSLSVKTVSTYRTRLLEKMGMASNSDLTCYAFKKALID